MDIQLDESNNLLFKVIKLDNNQKTDINEFIELFLEKGPFEHLLTNLVGCSYHNQLRQIFSVTFKTETEQSIITDILSQFLTPKTNQQWYISPNPG